LQEDDNMGAHDSTACKVTDWLYQRSITKNSSELYPCQTIHRKQYNVQTQWCSKNFSTPSSQQRLHHG